MSSRGYVESRTVIPTAALGGPQKGIGQIANALRKLVHDNTDGIVGIGIACPGPVDLDTGTVSELYYLPNWDGFDIVTSLTKEFGVEVVVENDAVAAAFGESVWGYGQNASRFLYISVGTGIGGAFFIDGQPYRGARGIHPEIGHHIIDPVGPQCTCGSFGCWESLASCTALVRWYLQLQDADTALELPVTAKAICSAASAGDSRAQVAVHLSR